MYGTCLHRIVCCFQWSVSWYIFPPFFLFFHGVSFFACFPAGKQGITNWKCNPWRGKNKALRLSSTTYMQKWLAARVHNFVTFTFRAYYVIPLTVEEIKISCINWIKGPDRMKRWFPGNLCSFWGCILWPKHEVFWWDRSITVCKGMHKHNWTGSTSSPSLQEAWLKVKNAS